jgi:amidophosphoribosyltransferase
VEAAEGETDVKDFEVGVFCGKYKTVVPEGYFEHLSQPLGEKRKHTAGSNKEEETSPCKKVLIANGGPVNVAARPRKALGDDRAVGKGERGPEHQEDIRYVC